MDENGLKRLWFYLTIYKIIPALLGAATGILIVWAIVGR